MPDALNDLALGLFHTTASPRKSRVWAGSDHVARQYISVLCLLRRLFHYINQSAANVNSNLADACPQPVQRLKEVPTMTAMTLLITWLLCIALATAIGGLLRQNPVGGFALGMGFGPLGVLLAYFLEGDEPAT